MMPSANVLRRASFLATLLVLLVCPVMAGTVEQVVDLPVKVTDAGGHPVERAIKLTIFRDGSRARAGFLVLNHGRSGDPEERREAGRFRFDANAAYFVGLGYAIKPVVFEKLEAANAAYFIGLGYAVFVPTRIGYGASGGPDVEDSGPCRAKSYSTSLEAAAAQTLAVIAYARAQPYIDPDRGLLAGISVGGITTIAAAAKSPPGVRGAINFAGGHGGDPKNHPAKPCRDDLLEAEFARFGATTRVPTLWLYSENDQFFGADSPQVWLAAFRARGGTGRFVRLPPFGQDGHASFTGNPGAWQPEVDAFLAPLR